ncbi:MAG: hypothetical protein M1832_001986 [Thelocarpon impressellum]|nr:MAG: hypothetical protein M1832_001986 [Thelocarpon impressellum]
MDITAFIASRRDQALLLGDYNAYRAQLSRRLLTLRKKLGRTSAKGKKYTGGIPISAEDFRKNNEFVHLPLLTSERAWAHAMHMKSTHVADTSAKEVTGSTRRHIISRLKKAVRYANELLELLANRPASGATDVDELEARAYASWLDGAVGFEQRNWKNSLRSYSEARVIYAALLASSKQDVFKDVLANSVDPSIRYAAYQSHMPRTLPIPTIARRCFPVSSAELVSMIEELDSQALSPKSSADNLPDSGAPEAVPKTITWRSRTVDIEDAAIATALGSVQSASAKLAQLLSSGAELDPMEKVSAYDDILVASQDAVDATKHAIDELVGEGVGQSDKRMQALQITRTAVNFDLVNWRVGRNRVLTGDSDGISMGPSVTTKLRKARKDGKDWVYREGGTAPKLARLTERIALYGSTLQIKTMQRLIQGETTRYRALVEIDQVSSEVGAGPKGGEGIPTPLIENLNVYPATRVDLKNLVSYPPRLEPVPVKPLFLDVAWNYIEYPGRTQKSQAKGETTGVRTEEQGSATAGGKKGWFGFGR